MLILKTFREEIFEREYSEMSLDILAVHNSGNGGYVEACLGCYVLQDHRLEMCLVSIHEIVVLIIHYGLHRTQKSIVSLFQCLHEPLCRVHFLLYESGGLLLLPLR